MMNTVRQVLLLSAAFAAVLAVPLYAADENEVAQKEALVQSCQQLRGGIFRLIAGFQQDLLQIITLNDGLVIKYLEGLHSMDEEELKLRAANQPMSDTLQKKRQRWQNMMQLFLEKDEASVTQLGGVLEKHRQLVVALERSHPQLLAALDLSTDVVGNLHKKIGMVQEGLASRQKRHREICVKFLPQPQKPQALIQKQAQSPVKK